MIGRKTLAMSMVVLFVFAYAATAVNAEGVEVISKEPMKSISPGQTATFKVTVVNTKNISVDVYCFGYPENLKVSVNPSTVAAGATQDIEIKVEADALAKEGKYELNVKSGSDQVMLTVEVNNLGFQVGGINILGIVGAIIQLILGIALAMFAIFAGTKVLAQLLPEIKIWDEIKKKNSGVGALTAGVVIAYTNVITRGIMGMSKAVSVNPSLFGFAAGFVSVLIGIGLSSLGITIAFKALDRLTKDIDETEELKKGNLAVGLLIAGILYGVSSMIASAVDGLGAALGVGL